MAATLCATPSGSLSGDLASRHGTPAVCGGFSPGYWKNHAKEWPSNLPTTTPFGQLLRTSNGTPYQSIGMLKILSHQDFDTGNIGMHFAATYLNIVTRKMNVLTVAQLQSMWFSYRTKGYYAPTAGVQWNCDAIVVYLKGTMDLVKD